MDAPLDARIAELARGARLRLEQLGSEEGRRSTQRFFQEPVRCFGVRSPAVKEIAAGIAASIRDWTPAGRGRLCDTLWTGGEVENGALVAYILARFAKRLGPDDFALCERWVEQRIDNWANCDAICTVPVAACVARYPELASRVSSWTSGSSRWQRRAAAVGLVKEARAGRQLGVILATVTALRIDPDEMVQKGVGWLLKESYPKHPGEVVQFLRGGPMPFPRLVLRYAAEKMTAADRAVVLRAAP